MKKLLLLATLLLASCSQNPIDTFYKGQVKEYTYTETIKNCPITKWNAEILIGSSMVKREILTQCVNSYYVEIKNNNNQIYDQRIYEYKLTNYNRNVFVLNDKIMKGQELITIQDYIDGLK